MTWNSIVFWVKVTSGQFVQAVVIGLDEDDEDDEDDHVLAKVVDNNSIALDIAAVRNSA